MAKAKSVAAAKKKPLPPQGEVPRGYWRDANGALFPEAMIKPIDRERDTLVKALIAEGKAQSQLLSGFKAGAMTSIAAFVERSAAEYEAKVGGRKGNVTLFSFDGRYKILRANQDHMDFDERMQAARSLIDECVVDYSKGARTELKAIVNRAFRVDGSGKVSVSRVLDLMRTDIPDERWIRARKALMDSLQAVGSKSYIRMYERDDNGEYQPIPLDVASA